MAVSLGINPITWTNDDMPELGGDIPLDACLAETRIAGFAGIELGGKFPRRADILRPIMAAHGLELVSGWYSAHLCRRSVVEEEAAVASHLDLLAAMGCASLASAEPAGSTPRNWNYEIKDGKRVPKSNRVTNADGSWREESKQGNCITVKERSASGEYKETRQCNPN